MPPIETVLIPAEDRSTVCVSSQAGCTRHCVFCATATMGFRRQLSAGEIVLQYLVARAEGPARPDPRATWCSWAWASRWTTWTPVLAAVDVLTDARVAPPRRGSTSPSPLAGVLPGLERFLQSSRAQIALSLNATTDAQRERLMPHNRVSAHRDVAGRAARDHAAQITLGGTSSSTCCGAGVNDTDDDARRLASLLAEPARAREPHPHNPFAGSALEPPTPARCWVPEDRARRRRALPVCAGRAAVRSPRPAGSWRCGRG